MMPKTTVQIFLDVDEISWRHRRAGSILYLENIYRFIVGVRKHNHCIQVHDTMQTRSELPTSCSKAGIGVSRFFLDYHWADIRQILGRFIQRDAVMVRTTLLVATHNMQENLFRLLARARLDLVFRNVSLYAGNWIRSRAVVITMDPADGDFLANELNLGTVHSEAMLRAKRLATDAYSFNGLVCLVNRNVTADTRL